jgi:SAM-dependent methyltransferase
VTSDDAPPEQAAPVPAQAALAAYLLVEPFVSGRLVVDVGPRPPRAAERLQRAGAREVREVDGPDLPLAEATADVVLCVSRLAGLANDVDRHRWLLELRRIVRPGGFCLVRVPVANLATAEESAESVLRELVRHHFGVVDLVAEAPLSGVAFLAPHTDEAAINEELAPIAATPTHLIALCAVEPPRPWSVPESLLVPLRAPPGEVAPAAEEVAALREEVEVMRTRYQDSCRDRDALRESLMTLQDRLDQQDQALSALRRQAARHLRQISEGATALELAVLERSRLERQLSPAAPPPESENG